MYVIDYTKYEQASAMHSRLAHYKLPRCMVGLRHIAAGAAASWDRDMLAVNGQHLAQCAHISFDN
jgi:hypothetical protein